MLKSHQDCSFKIIQEMIVYHLFYFFISCFIFVIYYIKCSILALARRYVAYTIT